MTTVTARTGTNGGTAAPSRMTLASVRRKIEVKPDRILLMGTEGVGKTTFAAESDRPIFLCAEDGIPAALMEVPRFPTPENFAEVKEAIRTLANEDHDYGTFVIDTLDWLEPLIWKDICTRNGWLDSEGHPDIEKPGYGKGYVAANEEWRTFLAALDVLRRKKGMEIILLAHTSIKTFQNPAGDDYSRYECKLHRGAAALVKEWTDVNLFAIHEEFVQEVKGRKKGISTGRRVIHTERNAAWDAKNRHSLPGELPLSYTDYVEARIAGLPADPADLWDEGVKIIEQLALTADLNTKTTQWMEKARDRGASTLARAVDTLRSRLAEKGEN